MLVQSLVGGRFTQRSEVPDIRSDLDVIEIRLVDERRDHSAPAVPRHLKLRVILVDTQRQLVHPLRVTVTTHEGNASDVVAVFLHEGIDGISV